VQRLHCVLVFLVKCSLLSLVIGPFYKNELELKSISREILPGNCKFICDSTPQLKLTKLKHEVLKFDFQRKEERHEHR